MFNCNKIILRICKSVRLDKKLLAQCFKKGEIYERKP